MNEKLTTRERGRIWRANELLSVAVATRGRSVPSREFERSLRESAFYLPNWRNVYAMPRLAADRRGSLLSISARDDARTRARIHADAYCRRRCTSSMCIPVYKYGIPGSCSGTEEAAKRRRRRRSVPYRPATIRISLSWRRCGGAFKVSRREGRANRIEQIATLSKLSERTDRLRRMRDTIVRAWLVPGTFSSLTSLW